MKKKSLINRFKKHPDAKPNSTSEFYSHSDWSCLSITIPEMKNSDRFRQETLFTSTFLSCQPELNLEQSETISAIADKWNKVIDGEQLDGTEPSITFDYQNIFIMFFLN
jgi:hypothetical protein